MRQFVWAGTIAMLCVPLAVSANGEERPRGERKAERARTIAWDSPGVQKMWALVLAKEIRPDEGGKNVWNDRLVLFERAITEKFSKEDFHALASSCATMPYGASTIDLSAMVYRALLDLFMDDGDRDGLVTLLAAHFISESLGETTEGILACRCGVEPVLAETDTLDKGLVFRSDVERALAHRYDEAAVVDKKDAVLVKRAVEWYEKHKCDPGMGVVRLKDAILIVTDAYSRSKIPAVRKEIAEALRRAFKGLGVGGKSDDEFVANAARYYAQHRDRLWVNDGYGDQPGGDDRPLFELWPSGHRPR